MENISIFFLLRDGCEFVNQGSTVSVINLKFELIYF